MEINELLDRVTNIINNHGLSDTVQAWQTLKAAVLAQQTNNTGSPKLPTLEECIDHVGRKRQSFFVMESRVQQGVEDCYEFIEQKLRNGTSGKCLCETCETTGCRGVEIPFKGKWTMHECEGFTKPLRAGA